MLCVCFLFGAARGCVKQVAALNKWLGLLRSRSTPTHSLDALMQSPPPRTHQVPSAPNRAQPWRPDPVLLYTGADKAAADELAANLLPKPAATAANLLGVQVRHCLCFQAYLCLPALRVSSGAASRVLEVALSREGLRLHECTQ